MFMCGWRWWCWSMWTGELWILVNGGAPLWWWQWCSVLHSIPAGTYKYMYRYVCHVCCNLDSNWRKSTCTSINTNEVTSFSVAICMKLMKSLTFALRITRASSRNVAKLYRTVKLSAENLRLFRSILILILLVVALEYSSKGFSDTGDRIIKMDEQFQILFDVELGKVTICPTPNHTLALHIESFSKVP